MDRDIKRQIEWNLTMDSMVTDGGLDIFSLTTPDPTLHSIVFPKRLIFLD